MTFTRLTFGEKAPKILQGDPKFKSTARSAWRSIDQVRILYAKLFPVFSYLSNIQPQNPVQRALDNANATLNR